MGGLVLKEWLRYNPSKCSNGASFSVRAVAFAGTPHLGASETISTLLVGFKRPVLSFGPVAHLESWFEQVTSSISQSALWLPGSYDLLPIYDQSDCSLNRRSKILGPISFKDDTSDAQQVDIYQISSWEKLKFLTYMRNQNYQIPTYATISNHLGRAKEDGCRIAQFDPHDVVPDRSEHYYAVTYIAARSHKTLDKIQFATDPAQYTFTLTEGDGTVTFESASNLFLSRPRNVMDLKGPDF